MLHVTNGDSAAQSLRQAGLPGTVIAWRDVLHEGPVPEGLAPDELRAVRARYIAEMGWGAYDDVLADMAARDQTLEDAVAQDEVVLWFEHDLYDQLQLIQILDRVAERDAAATRLSLVCIGDYPVEPRFIGLGQLSPQQLAGLFPDRQAVSPDELALGRAAWAAFRGPDPTAIERLLATGATALPYLAGALTRHLEQFPATGDGLSRTERLALAAVAGGTRNPLGVFAATQDREERPFLGDATFWAHLRGLTAEPHPLLAVAGGGTFTLPGATASGADFAAQELALTESGGAVLAGEADWVALHGIDRWLGGVHLQGSEAAWRWDGAGQRLVARNG